MKEMWKTRCRIVKVAGDLYYEEMDIEVALKEAVQKIEGGMTREGIETYIEGTMNKKMPFDMPQWQLRFSYNYNGDKNKMCVVYKNHHSFSDGISSYSFMLCMGSEFDRSKMMKFDGLPWFNRLMLRVMVPFYIPQIVYNILKVKQDKNPMNCGPNKKLTGIKKVATSRDVDFMQLKRSSRYHKITINNLVTSCVSAALAKYFEEKGEKSIKSINLAIPANIRLKPYKTRMEVRNENKFAALTLTVPLHKDIEVAKKQVPKSLVSLRDFGLIYATWVFTEACNFLSPTFVQQMFFLDFTKKFTMAFSNTPGLIKQLEFKGKFTEKNFGYINASGNLGISLICISYVNYFCFTCVAD